MLPTSRAISISFILEHDWKTLGPKLRGKIHIYVGNMNNYSLQMYIPCAVKRMEQTAPPDVSSRARQEDVYRSIF
jgi:hypothetical protein